MKESIFVFHLGGSAQQEALSGLFVSVDVSLLYAPGVTPATLKMLLLVEDRLAAAVQNCKYRFIHHCGCLLHLDFYQVTSSQIYGACY